MVVSPEEVLEAQASASGWNLVLYAAITIFHGMGTGSGLGYAGLVLPHHTNSSSSALVTSVAKSSRHNMQKIYCFFVVLYWLNLRKIRHRKKKLI